MHTSNSLVFIIWLVFLALGTLGAPYGYYSGNRWFGYGGGIFLFIAILMLKLMAF